ncbi:MAG: glycosyltransferase family 4 protein, partial [Gammaproteobacteria bacterium]
MGKSNSGAITSDGSPSPDTGNRALRRPSYVFIVPWDLHHPGGVNQVVINLYREMLQDGEMEPLVMVKEWSALSPIEQVTDGFRTFHMRLWAPWSERGTILSTLKWFVAAPFYLASLLWFCRRYRVVAFNFHYPTLDVFPIALLQFFGLYRGTLILSFHGADLREAKRDGYVGRLLWRFVLARATAIVACSEAFALRVREFAGRAAGRVQTVRNGLDIDHFLDKVDRAATLDESLRGREFILSVATFEEKKGLDMLLRAFAEIRSTVPGLALVLVGRPSRAESILRVLAKELGISEDVFFFKSVPHPQIGLFLE